MLLVIRSYYCKQLATKAARKSAPATGGVKKPHGVYCLAAAFKLRKVKKTPNYLRLFCSYS